MDDEDFLNALQKETEESTHESSIRIIADAIYSFLEKYYIEFNPLERERLCLYLVHYRNSRKAAAHIYHIHQAMKKIPNCNHKISLIIEKTQEELLEKELLEQTNQMDHLFQKTTENSTTSSGKQLIRTEKRRKKISSIKSFIKNSENTN